MFGVCLAAEKNASRMQNWDYVLSHFVPDNIFVLGDCKLPHSKPFQDAVIIEDTDEIPGLVTLLAPEKGRYVSGEIDLYSYRHPLSVTYVFGPDNGHVERYHGVSVYIPTDSHDEMYSFVACAITLYDRRLKTRG